MTKWRAVSLIKRIVESYPLVNGFSVACTFDLGRQTHFGHVFCAGIMPALFGLNLKRAKILQ